MADADLIAIRMRLTGGSQVAAEAKEANTAIAETGATAKAAGAASASSAAKIAKTATSLKSIGRGMTTYMSLPLAGIGIASGMMALDFDRSMRNVNSIAGLPEKRFERLKQQVLDLAGPTAQSPKTLAEGMYDLVSSGFDADQSLRIIRASALAASAGLTTTEVSTKAVAAVLNAYQLPATQATKVSDTLFETVNRGVLTFEQLSTTIGDVLPFASQLNVNLNEVGAAVSTMTKAGLSAPETMTRIKNVLVTLIKPGKDLSSLFKEMGTTGEKLVAKRGLQGALEEIVKHTDGSKEAIAELFPNIRAMGGVLSLTGDNAHRAAEDLASFKDTSGATAKVLHQQEKSFGFQLQRGWAELSAVLIELGQDLLPIVVPFLLKLANAAKDAVGWFAHLPGPMQEVGMVLAGLAILAGPILMLAGSILSTVVALDALGVTLAGVAIATGIGAAVIAIAAAFYLAYTRVKWFHDAVDDIVSFAKAHWRLLGPLLIAPFGPFLAIAVLVVLNFGKIKAAGVAFVSFIGIMVGKAGHAIATLPGLIWSALSKIPRLIGLSIAFWAVLPIRVAWFVGQMTFRLFKLLGSLALKLPGLAGRAVSALVRGFISHAPAVFHFWLALNLRIVTFMATLPFKMAALGVRITIGLAKGLARGVVAIASKLFEVGKSMASQIANGLKRGLSDLLPGPVKDALGAAGGVAGEVGGFIGGAFANGTSFAPGGLSLVGETGPEIVDIPRGSRVIPAPRTRDLLAPFTRSPQTASAAKGFGGGGGRTRYLVAAPIKIGRREVANVVVEAQEDAEARL